MNPWPRIVWRLALALLMVAPATLGVAGDTERASAVATTPVTATDTAPLRRIESRVLKQTLKPGPPRLTNLPAYYYEANPQLVKRLMAAHDAYECGDESFRGMTLIAGDAGIGKTFLKSQAIEKNDPKGDISKFDIRELYRSWEAAGYAAPKPELRCGELVLSKMLAVTDRSAVSVADYLEAQGAKIYVIDSLDEVHQDEYGWILEEIEDFVFRRADRCVHVVVLGRPFAFREYWGSRRHRTSPRGNPELFVLEPPKFETVGDFQVSTWNYYGFAHDLRWAPQGEPEAMPLEAFIQWCNVGFPRDGSFATVKMQPEVPNVAAEYRLLEEWARTKPLVGSMLYNLAGNGIIRRIVAEQVARGETDFDERSIMRGYLAEWMERDSEHAGRPSAAMPEMLDLYMQGLEAVAVRFVVDDRLDGDGYFVLGKGERITLEHQGRRVSLPVMDLLHHSAMKHLDLRQTEPERLRFEPIWFHRLLCELHNERAQQFGEPLATAVTVGE